MCSLSLSTELFKVGKMINYFKNGYQHTMFTSIQNEHNMYLFVLGSLSASEQ